MPANRLSRVIAFAAVFPGAAMAIGLGDIRLNSSLNAPLDADIELIGATPDELASLKAQIASRDTFARYGLEWPAYLSSISLRPAKSADGRDVIRLRSSEAITEPFVTVLVEVNWARGRLVREYTVLLDPPLYTPGEKAAVPVAVPVTGSGSRSGTVERRPETPAPAPGRQQAAAPAPAVPSSRPAPRTPVAGPAPSTAAEGDTYQVRPGDSLSRIAGRLAGGPPPERRRWMVAAFRGNPAAFDGNMNLLRSGAVLRVPDAASVSAISAGDALAEVRRQAAQWRGAAPATAAAPAPAEQPGRLRLVTPSAAGDAATGTTGATAAPSAAGPAAAGSAGSLQGQVQELQKQLEESKRLLEMRSAELAQLQARIAAGNGQGAAPMAGAAAPAAAPGSAPAQGGAPAGTEGPATAQAPATEAAPAAPAAEAAKPAAETATPRKPVAPAPAAASEDGSILGSFKEFWWAIAALLAALVGLFGYRAWRARQEEAFDDSLGRLAGSGGDSLPPCQPETSPVRANAPAPQSFLVEESGAGESPRAAVGASAAAAPLVKHVAADETISTEGAVNIDQGDPLAEADFHMAYGLYDQAADLIRIAIAREPERRDLRMKLLEVYFVWGNKDQFVQAAHEVAKTRFEAAPGEWEKVVIMGRQLAPEDPLFAGGAPSRGLASAGVDLNLEGGQNRVDFDVVGEPASSATTATEMALSSQDPTTELPAVRRSDGVQFEVDATGAFDMTRAATGETTRTMAPQANTGAAGLLADVEDAQSEGPTVEQPALGRGAHDRGLAATGKYEQPGRDSSGTQEIDLDDLGFDVGPIDATAPYSSSGAADAPTLLAGIDDRSRRLMEEAEGRGSSGAAERPAVVSIEASSTSQIPALAEVDLDLGADGSTPDSSPSRTERIDVSTLQDAAASVDSTERLSSADLGLPDLDSATMGEVGTKLDLARAYIDMGDPEGARSILGEVIEEGSPQQKAEAQRLIDTLPG